MEILVVLVVGLVVLGPNRLPDAGRRTGKALAELRRWSNGVAGELRAALDVTPSATDADRGDERAA